MRRLFAFMILSAASWSAIGETDAYILCGKHEPLRFIELRLSEESGVVQQDNTFFSAIFTSREVRWDYRIGPNLSGEVQFIQATFDRSAMQLLMEGSISGGRFEPEHFSDSYHCTNQPVTETPSTRISN